MKWILICVLLLGFSFVAGVEYTRMGELELPETGFVMRSEALIAINNSENIIDEMRRNNFSVVGVSNDLIKAKEIFQLVDYSEVLRDGDASAEDRWEAINAIGLMDWSGFHYGEVLEYTNAIIVVGEKAFLSYESLILAKVIYEEYLENDVLGSGVEEMELIERAEDAFYGERYDEAENLALMAQEIAESGIPKGSFFNQMKGGVVGFFRGYWVYVLVLIGFLVGFFAKKIIGKD